MEIDHELIVVKSYKISIFTTNQIDRTEHDYCITEIVLKRNIH